MDFPTPAGRRAPYDPTPPARPVWPWVTLVLAVSLGIRIALLPYRWVNPDEGAHLMDGKLVVDGLIPILNFDARQVLYVYLLAAWQRLVGSDLLAARVLPMLLGVAGTGLVFALGRYLVGIRAALVATATYAFLPVAVIWSLNVQLQAVTLVSTCLGYLALARALRTEGSPASLALVGAMFGVTFYVRETGLVHLMAAAIVVAALEWRAPRRLARQLAALVGGFAAVALVILAVFSRYLSPVQTLAIAAQPIPPSARSAGQAARSAVGRQRRAPRRYATRSSRGQSTLRNLRDAGWLGSFLLIAPVVALAGRVIARRPSIDAVAALILTAWLGSLGLAYGYWVIAFGFYPQYFTEFLPPLVILFGAVTNSAAEVWLPERGRGVALALSIVALAGAFAAGARVTVPALAYVTLLALVLAAAGAGLAGLRRWGTAAAACAAAALITIALAAVLPPGVERGLRGLLLLVGLAAALAAVVPFRQSRLDRLAFGCSCCSAAPPSSRTTMRAARSGWPTTASGPRRW